MIRGTLVTMGRFDNFRQVLKYAPEEVSEDVLTAVRDLDEREELEPFIRTRNRLFGLFSPMLATRHMARQRSQISSLTKSL